MTGGLSQTMSMHIWLCVKAHEKNDVWGVSVCKPRVRCRLFNARCSPPFWSIPTIMPCIWKHSARCIVPRKTSLAAVVINGRLCHQPREISIWSSSIRMCSLARAGRNLCLKLDCQNFFVSSEFSCWTTCTDSSFVNGSKQTTPIQQWRTSMHHQHTESRKSFQSVILDQRFTTRSLIESNRHLHSTNGTTNCCKYQAVSPTSRAQAVSTTWSTNQSRDSFLGGSDDNAVLHDRTSDLCQRVVMCTTDTPHPWSFKASTPALFLFAQPLSQGTAAVTPPGKVLPDRNSV